MKKLYKVQRIDNYSYCDDYEMVVCAVSEEEALKTYPGNSGHYNETLERFIGYYNKDEYKALSEEDRESVFTKSSWVEYLSDLQVTYLGIADEETDIGPILVANVGG